MDMWVISQKEEEEEACWTLRESERAASEPVVVAEVSINDLFPAVSNDK